jgi:hypothetical protein
MSNVARLFICLILLGLALAPARAQQRMIEAQRMNTTTPFGQAKLTDAAGNVSYRVGAVFTAPDNANQRVSMTFICQTGGAFSLYVVQTRVPQDQASGPSVAFEVDGRPVPAAARREIGNGLSAYTVTSGAEAEALAKAMGAGKALRMTLDDRAYAVSLDGLGGALTQLAGVCPHG